MRASTLVAIGVMAISLRAGAQENYKPPAGYVPDAATAIGIAVAVWLPIYGQKRIDTEKPYIATLKGDVWTVVGTFNCKGHCVGGVALAEISKQDGTILRVIHGM
jgi:NTF2 fold immunity protein